MGRIKMMICDDEEAVREHYKRLFKDHMNENELEIDVYGSASEALKNRAAIRQTDIALLDICMADMDGIHMAEMLRKINPNIRIIFISNSEEYVFDSFKVRPLNYILKNKISDGELILIIQEVLEDCKANAIAEDFICYNKDRSVVLRVDDIIAFESVNRMILVYTIHGEYTSRVQLQDLYIRYRERGFEKANRSCIVNMQHILRIEGTEIHMSRKLKFQIAYRSKGLFKEKFQQFLLTGKL